MEYDDIPKLLVSVLPSSYLVGTGRSARGGRAALNEAGVISTTKKPITRSRLVDCRYISNNQLTGSVPSAWSTLANIRTM